MKFYIGSGMKNCELVNSYAEILKENGWEQTYDWVKNVHNEGSVKKLTEYAQLEQQGILDSEVFILVLPGGRGAHIELGMALALHKKIFLCSHMEEAFRLENTVAFYGLPNITRLVGTVSENSNRILEYTGI